MFDHGRRPSGQFSRAPAFCLLLMTIHGQTHFQGRTYYRELGRQDDRARQRAHNTAPGNMLPQVGNSSMVKTALFSLLPNPFGPCTFYSAPVPGTWVFQVPQYQVLGDYIFPLARYLLIPRCLCPRYWEISTVSEYQILGNTPV